MAEFSKCLDTLDSEMLQHFLDLRYPWTKFSECLQPRRLENRVCPSTYDWKLRAIRALDYLAYSIRKETNLKLKFGLKNPDADVEAKLCIL